MLSSHETNSAVKKEPLGGKLPRPPTSYTLKNSLHARLTTAFHASLTLSSAPTTDLGPDVPNLSLTFDHQTPTRLRVLIRDTAATRWTVPRDVVALDPDGPEPKVSGAIRQLAYNYDASPFGFCVTRTDAEEDAPALFDTRTTDFVFKEQYLEISSKVPEGANVYGLGEMNSSFKRRFASEKDGEEKGTVTTLWSRDAPVPRDENVYGAHPFYMEMRDGKAHGVLLLNSNGMDVLLTPGKITYKVIGGVFDFYFFAGPTPADVVMQYLQLIGRPTMPPLWALGAHQCRWGYDNIEKVRKVLSGYKEAKVPLDCVWLDIDYMDSFKMFTYDPIRFPPEAFRALLDDLHSGPHPQRMVIILDPGVKVERGYEAFEDGLRRGVFLRFKRPRHPNEQPLPGDVAVGEDEVDTVFVGRVWPGKTAWPDWFNPEAQAYWTEQIRKWYDQFPVDGLWIDMNELSNFSDGDCSALSEAEARAIVPTGDQTVDEMVETTSSEAKKHNQIVESELYNQIVENELHNVLDAKPTDSSLVVESTTSDLTSPSAIPIPTRPEPIAPFSYINPPYAINNGGTWEPLHTRTSAQDAYHHGGVVEYDVHNLYGHMESKATFEALQSVRPDERPFVLTRSSFVGTGRWAAHWLGDNWSTYDDMADSIVGVFNFQLFGIPLVGADIGGFNEVPTEELMIRWTQLGSFYPFLRNHNILNAPGQEPYCWSSVTETARRYYALRLALLPYWYTLFQAASTRGTTVIRPLMFEYPNDPVTYDIERQFLVGAALLVSPVLDEGAETVRAYVPPTDRWYAFPVGTEEHRQGWVEFEAPLEEVPVHVRGGSVVPMWTRPGLTTAETRAESKISLVVALNREGTAEGEVYLDDGSVLPAGRSWWGRFVVSEGGKMVRVTEVNKVGTGEGAECVVGEVVVLGLKKSDGEIVAKVGRDGRAIKGRWEGERLVVDGLNENLEAGWCLSWI